MNTLEMRLKEFEIQRKHKSDDDALAEILDKEIRGALKLAFQAHPEGPKFESLRKRLLGSLSSHTFLKRIKPYIRD